jgi:hypothetical protein
MISKEIRQNTQKLIQVSQDEPNAARKCQKTLAKLLMYKFGKWEISCK